MGDDVKVAVDPTRCKGYAVCMFEAPEVFELGDDNVAYVIDESPPDELREKVETAVRLCPTSALSIAEDA
ncbi:MAG: ferredoxin [Actinomycetota bacterium]